MERRDLGLERGKSRHRFDSRRRLRRGGNQLYSRYANGRDRRADPAGKANLARKIMAEVTGSTTEEARLQR